MSTRPYLLLAVLVLAGCASPPPPSLGKGDPYDTYYANHGLVLPTPSKARASSSIDTPSSANAPSGREKDVQNRAQEIYSGADWNTRQQAYRQAYKEAYGADKEPPPNPGNGYPLNP